MTHKNLAMLQLHITYCSLVQCICTICNDLFCVSSEIVLNGQKKIIQIVQVNICQTESELECY